MLIERCSKCGKNVYYFDNSNTIYAGLEVHHIVCPEQKGNNMADQIEITVKVNDVETPLHKISKQTLLTVRENSKPKEVPFVRISDTRLILRVPPDISRFEGKVIAISLYNGRITDSWFLERDNEWDGVPYYTNVRTIS